jgi:hypothetical protein
MFASNRNQRACQLSRDSILDATSAKGVMLLDSQVQLSLDTIVLGPGTTEMGWSIRTLIGLIIQYWSIVLVLDTRDAYVLYRIPPVVVRWKNRES